MLLGEGARGDLGVVAELRVLADFFSLLTSHGVARGEAVEVEAHAAVRVEQVRRGLELGEEARIAGHDAFADDGAFVGRIADDDAFVAARLVDVVAGHVLDGRARLDFVGRIADDDAFVAARLDDVVAGHVLDGRAQLDFVGRIADDDAFVAARLDDGVLGRLLRAPEVAAALRRGAAGRVADGDEGVERDTDRGVEVVVLALQRVAAGADRRRAVAAAGLPNRRVAVAGVARRAPAERRRALRGDQAIVERDAERDRRDLGLRETRRQVRVRLGRAIAAAAEVGAAARGRRGDRRREGPRREFLGLAGREKAQIVEVDGFLAAEALDLESVLLGGEGDAEDAEEEVLGGEHGRPEVVAG